MVLVLIICQFGDEGFGEDLGEGLSRHGEGSAEEATVGVFVDDVEGGCEGIGLWVGWVGMPLAVRTLPVDTPDSLAADIAELGDGFLNLLVRMIEGRTHEE